jgi:hypothetical protein
MKKTMLFRCPSLSFNKLISQIFAVLALACAFAMPLAAQSPKISIQGTLKTADGSTVEDGTYPVTFKLYNAETGGTALWQEDASVDLVGGIYSYYLGSVTPLNAANFDTTLWLGVKVGSYELVPRSQLAYAPYAFSVTAAQTVVCSGALGDVKYSILSPTQFAAQNGACWVPMDGRPLATTDKLRQVTGKTSVPNGGGLFIRAQDFAATPPGLSSNNDPERTNATVIATLQADEFKGHTHIAQNAGDHFHKLKVDTGGGGPHGIGDMINSGYEFGVAANQLENSNNAGDHTHVIDASGGLETRPKNLNFWVYIRIN